jgi:hypothetical protein
MEPIPYPSYGDLAGSMVWNRVNPPLPTVRRVAGSGRWCPALPCRRRRVFPVGAHPDVAFPARFHGVPKFQSMELFPGRDSGSGAGAARQTAT